MTLQRLLSVAVVAVVLAFPATALAGDPPGPQEPTVCAYKASNHRVRVTAPNGGTLARTATGHITFNSMWCGRVATVNNTDSIVVLSGAGTQFVVIEMDGGGFRPGFTNEPGGSDEIEISVSLGGDSDSLTVRGSSTADDHIVIGKSSGFAVLGKMNLNASETTGVDADLTLIIGIEERIVSGNGGKDVLSGAGGFGTGNQADFLLKMDGGDNGDDITGGSAGDHLFGNAGPDVLKGAGGADYIDSQDGVNGNDQIFGGGGTDTCFSDSGDSLTSCP
jgi:Ca2+-binding RTX toxin-like protein